MDADIRIYPGKEMKALDMAEIMDASIIGSGIIQGCGIVWNSSAGTLYISGGRIMLKGRLGVVTAGYIEIPTLSAEADCKLTVVCNLQNSDSPFYIRLLTNAEYSTIASSASTGDTFNVQNGIAYLVLGVAHVNPSTNKVTSWTADSSTSIRRTNNYFYNQLKSSSTTALNEAKTELQTKLTQWTTYLSGRTSSYARFSMPGFGTTNGSVSPAWIIASGQVRALTLPAVWGATVTATSADNRTESFPADNGFTRTYTSDYGIPNNFDTDQARYIPLAATGIWLSSNTTYGGAENCHQLCFIQGWNFNYINSKRHLIVYVKNVGSTRAVVDLHAIILYVRRD